MNAARKTDAPALLNVELNTHEVQVAQSFLQKLAASEERLAARARELHAASGDDAHAAFARETDERAKILRRLHHAFSA